MKTEQTDRVLETEIVAGVAEDNAENSNESYLALKIFVTVKNTLLNPDVFPMVELWVLQIKKKKQLLICPPNSGWE